MQPVTARMWLVVVCAVAVGSVVAVGLVAAPAGAGFNDRGYERIERGMTRDRVARILDRPGKVVDRSPIAVSPSRAAT